MGALLCPSKKRVIEILLEKNYQSFLPIVVGNGAPEGQIELSNGVFSFNTLAVAENKHEEIERLAKKTIVEQHVLMPENEWQLREKTQCLYKSYNKQSFINFIKNMEWRYGGTDNYNL